jgi:hypothetical protein
VEGGWDRGPCGKSSQGRAVRAPCSWAEPPSTNSNFQEPLLLLPTLGFREALGWPEPPAHLGANFGAKCISE